MKSTLPPLLWCASLLFRKTLLFFLLIFLASVYELNAQSADCQTAEQMCPDQGATTYRATTGAGNAQPGNNYGCLGSTPNPAWFFLSVGSSGTATIQLTNSANVDIDFAMWGPFPNLGAALGNCGSLPVPTDCSYSPAPTETVDFPFSSPGQIYLLMITNFSNQQTNITADDPQYPNTIFSCSPPPPPGCMADAGSISSPAIAECFQSPLLNLSLPPVYIPGPPPPASEYSYTYLISDQSGTIVAIDPGPNLSNFQPGVYSVCGLSYENIASGQIPGLIGQNVNTLRTNLDGASPPFCGDVTVVCVDVTIGAPIPPTNLPNATICAGDCITGPGGAPICAPGNYSITLAGANGCDSIVNLTVIELPAATGSITMDVCEGGCVFVAGQFVCAPGPVDITLVAANGCDSILTVHFNVLNVNAVISPNPPDQLSCDNPVVTLDGSFSTFGSSLTWKDGFGTFLGSNTTYDVTTQGSYRLVATLTQGGLTCRDSLEVFVFGNTLAPDIFTTDTPEACEGEGFDLFDLNIIDGNNLNPIYTFHSGTPATVSNRINSFVNPAATTTYYILGTANGCSDETSVTLEIKPVPEFIITDQPQICEGENYDLRDLNIVFSDPNVQGIISYHENSPATQFNQLFSPVVSPPFSRSYFVLADFDDCTYEQEIFIEVIPTPDAVFFVDREICLTDEALVSYGGSVSGNAIFTWDFDGGIANPGDGVGPHTVRWDFPGNKVITLTVEDEGCLSTEHQELVFVDQPLDDFFIDCQPSVDSIIFDWPEINGALGYDVRITTGQTDNYQPTQTSLIVRGLQNGELVEIRVTAISDNNCPDIEVSQICQAEECPPIRINITTPEDTICLDNTVAPFQLTAAVSGSNGTGSGYWIGPGIVDSLSGLFDPRRAGAGRKTITYRFQEGNCIESENIEIQINSQPSADFQVADLICQGDTVTLTYTGNAGANARYLWNFGTGMAQPGIGAGPHRVTWSGVGNNTVTLQVVKDDCPSALFSDTVMINLPLIPRSISCISSLDSVVFTWTPDPIITDFSIEVDSIFQGTTRDTFFVVRNLSPGDVADIRVTANTAGPCPPVSSVQSCRAEDCPVFSISLIPVAPICLDSTLLQTTLRADVTGGLGNGQGSWSGPGVTDPITGIFDPYLAGVGAHQINYLYTEGNCTGNASFSVEIRPQPTAEFIATSPICLSDATVVQFQGNAGVGAGFQWNFDSGTAAVIDHFQPFLVNWTLAGAKQITLTVTDNGCTSRIYSVPVIIDPELNPPSLSCIETLDSIIFAWDPIPNSAGYLVSVNGATPQLMNLTDLAVTGLMPGDSVTLQVEALSANACPPVTNMLTCRSKDCPTLEITFQKADTICLDQQAAPIRLVADVTGGFGGGTGTWSGQSTSPDGTFDPVSAGPGLWLIDYHYEEGNCSVNGTMEIPVQRLPVADFEISSPVCVDALTEVRLSSNTPNGLVYQWNFDNPSVSNNIGVEAFELAWNTGGLKTISLEVTEGRCVSPLTEKTIQVFEKLGLPQISCDATTQSILFKWTDVPSATAYTVQVLNAPSQAITSSPDNFSFLIENLNPEEVASITLEVAQAGSSCPPVLVSQSCEALACTAVSIDFQGITDSCLLAGAMLSEQLNATVQGGSGNGSLTWSGDAVSAAGLFQPASPGTYTVFLRYTENNCSHVDSVIMNIHSVPEALFDANPVVCRDSSITLNFTGTAPSNARYYWNTGNGLPAQLTGPGPHRLTLPVAGQEEVTLYVEANGCRSATARESIQVDAPINLPVMQCSSTETSVEFCWPADPAVSQYDFIVLTGQTGNRNGNCIRFDQLIPNTEITVQLTASGASVCGPVQTVATCKADDCPGVVLAAQPIPSICLTPDAQAITVQPFVSADYPGGSWAWSGSGVSSNGTFDPQVAGIGRHSLQATYTLFGICTYQKEVDIIINDLPEADAGEAQVLDCALTPVTLGGQGNSVNPATVEYEWTNGNFSNPNRWNVSVNAPGTYRLQAVDRVTGCFSMDEVTVSQTTDFPNLRASLGDISCFGKNDGSIRIDTVTGGEGPYTYALNNDLFGQVTTFDQLGPGTYHIVVQDANFCTDTVSLTILQPDPMTVEIVMYLDNLIIENDGTVEWGDSIQLEAITNIAANLLGSVQWEPEGVVPICDDEVTQDNCTTVRYLPTGRTEFSVRVENKNGCPASDRSVINVKKTRPVYIPSAFSPGASDNINDLFLIYAIPGIVTNIKSFLIFDRWGETIFENYNFQPAPVDTQHGWDGRFHGKTLNSGVYVYFAEIEFADGEVMVFKGDVTLR